MSLSLVSINIEKSKHLKERVIPFLTKAKADVVCLQEAYEHEVEEVAKLLSMEFRFEPRLRDFDSEGEVRREGNAILSRFPIVSSSAHWYAGCRGETPVDADSSKGARVDLQHFALLTAEIEGFQIGTLHFPWTPNGEANDVQRNALKELLSVFEGLGEFVVVGDFNAPRGREIFDEIAAKYKDNIPVEYITSIDGSLHRAGPVPVMVDGLFSTPEYTVSGVSFSTGVSDHCAVTATVSH